MQYSPDELKAIILHYGSYAKAADKLRITRPTLTNAANADITGKAVRLTDDTTDKIYQHIKRLSPSTRQDIRQWEKLMAFAGNHPNVKRAFMAAQPKEQKWALTQRQKYSMLKQRIFWTKIMSKFYDRYQWRRGQFTHRKFAK